MFVNFCWFRVEIDPTDLIRQPVTAEGKHASRFFSTNLEGADIGRHTRIVFISRIENLTEQLVLSP